jgi:cobalt-zinc-cadmium resistance protein CzcA
MLHAWKLPSISLSESIESTTRIEEIVMDFPEVETVVSKIGRAEIATDVMGVEVNDILVMLKPYGQWTGAKSKEELVEMMNRKLSQVPGIVFSFLQPIEMRVSELIAGVRADIAIKVFGPDLDVLQQKGNEIERLVRQIQGAADAKAEQISGLPVLQIRVNRHVIARYGINVSDVLEIVETAIGGKAVGQILEQEKRFDLVLRYQGESRSTVETIRNILVAAPEGGRIPLSHLADIQIEEGAAQISREQGQRRFVVEVNVRGRDIGSFVAEAQQLISSNVELPPGYYLQWGGQFENMQRATARLQIVVPLTLLLIFVFLFSAFNSVTKGLLVFTGVPFAVSGGVLALYFRGIHFSISAGIGFVALFGVSVLNGIVIISQIIAESQKGKSTMDAILQGTATKLRPVLMTALVASLGFIPMALATGTGAEVQKPLATVVIGGLVSSTLLTLFVLPVLYRLFVRRPVQVGSPDSQTEVAGSL